MTRTKKDFRYGEGNEDLSNEFIEQVIAGGPQPKEMKSKGEPEDSTGEWKSGMYSDYKRDEDATRCTCARVWILFSATLLLVVGVGAIVVGIIQTHKDTFLPICPKCSNLITAFYIVGGVLLGVGVLGLGAANPRMRCLGVPYALIVSLLGIAALALAVAATLFGTGTVQLDLRTAWQDAVADDPSFVCDLQNQLSCSGYGSGCCFGPQPNQTVVTYNSSWCYNTTIPSWVPLTCSQSCVGSNQNLKTCDVAIEQAIKDNMVPIIATAYPVAVFLLLAGISGIRFACAG